MCLTRKSFWEEALGKEIERSLKKERVLSSPGSCIDSTEDPINEILKNKKVAHFLMFVVVTKCKPTNN